MYATGSRVPFVASTPIIDIDVGTKRAHIDVRQMSGERFCSTTCAERTGGARDTLRRHRPQVLQSVLVVRTEWLFT